MSARCLKVVCLAFVFLAAVSATRSAHAQYSCGAGYGNGYGYQNQSYYGQPSWPPSFGGYSGASFYSPNHYLPSSPIGFPNGFAPPLVQPQQSYYSNNYYGSQQAHYDPLHHPWHPGHYLLGHH